MNNILGDDIQIKKIRWLYIMGFHDTLKIMGCTDYTTYMTYIQHTSSVWCDVAAFYCPFPRP